MLTSPHGAMKVMFRAKSGLEPSLLLIWLIKLQHGVIVSPHCKVTERPETGKISLGFSVTASNFAIQFGRSDNNIARCLCTRGGS